LPKPVAERQRKIRNELGKRIWLHRALASGYRIGWGARMRHEPVQRHRRSLRLNGYNYAQAGAYFITVCIQDRACLFGHVADGAMRSNDAGQLATRLWHDLPARFSGLDVDAFVVMPNHVHGILVLSDVGAPLVGARVGVDEKAATRAAPTVGDIVGGFKSSFTVEYIRGVKRGQFPAFNRRIWQRNYYEHIIRDEPDLTRVRRYIEENPLRWDFDQENPLRVET
jgi:putative transposase